MKRKTKFRILDILGIFFLIWGLIAISVSMYNQNPEQVLYMCYLSLLIIGIGLLGRNSFIIMSQVYILATPLLIWNIDFIYWLIFQTPLWGITDYFFSGSHPLIGRIISLQHLFTVPISIWASKLIGLKRKDAWKVSIIQIILVFATILIFTPATSNINCIYQPCANLSFQIPYYTFVWFAIVIVNIILTAIILNTFLFKKTKKKK